MSSPDSGTRLLQGSSCTPETSPRQTLSVVRPPATPEQPLLSADGSRLRRQRPEHKSRQLEPPSPTDSASSSEEGSQHEAAAWQVRKCIQKVAQPNMRDCPAAACMIEPEIRCRMLSLIAFAETFDAPGKKEIHN